MSLEQQIASFIENPFPLWENALTASLVSAEWDSLVQHYITSDSYTTARSYLKDANLPPSIQIKIFGTTAADAIFVEYPQPEVLGSFYEDSGLELLNQNEIDTLNGIEKIQCALETLGKVPGVLDCISRLVKCIGILKQDDPEIDTSHSDPNIPSSIFVSICEDTSETSNLRVAESILHEAMHLKLTMIEHHVDIVDPGTEEMFYSPWRDVERPVRGVLHGLFVFSAVRKFYEKLLHIDMSSKNAKHRIAEINSELLEVLDLKYCKSVSESGKSLVSKLLQ